jgi:hypothetical protein
LEQERGSTGDYCNYVKYHAGYYKETHEIDSDDNENTFESGMFFPTGKMLFQPAHDRQQEVCDDETNKERREDADELHDDKDENEKAGDKGYKLPMLSDYHTD